MTGCASNLYTGGPSVAGWLYTGVKDPAQNLAVAVEPVTATKVGESSATAVFGLIAGGDASIDTAMKNGGITKVHHVDHQVQLFMGGLWAKTTTIVQGQ